MLRGSDGCLWCVLIRGQGGDHFDLKLRAVCGLAMQTYEPILQLGLFSLTMNDQYNWLFESLVSSRVWIKSELLVILFAAANLAQQIQKCTCSMRRFRSYFYNMLQNITDNRVKLITILFYSFYNSTRTLLFYSFYITILVRTCWSTGVCGNNLIP